MKILRRSLSLVTDIAPITVSYNRMKWIASENVAATHPRVDILILLSKSDYDPYRLCKELSLTYRVCYFHLKKLEEADLIGGKLRYHISEKGRQSLSRLDGRRTSLSD
jgi:predicted transcriptional regulator